MYKPEADAAKCIGFEECVKPIAHILHKMRVNELLRELGSTLDMGDLVLCQGLTLIPCSSMLKAQPCWNIAGL